MLRSTKNLYDRKPLEVGHENRTRMIILMMMVMMMNSSCNSEKWAAAAGFCVENLTLRLGGLGGWQG